MSPFDQLPPPAVVSLPLRVGPDGRLERASPAEALMRLFRAMAATSEHAWPHAPWFGLAEVFAAANPQLHDQQGIADALNRGLAGLGVRWARVAYVHAGPGAAYGERDFRIALELAGGQVVHDGLAV
jgi:hypothetical protein